MRKILDFNAKTLLSGIVGRPREIAWPCEMFRVTLPHLNDDGEREFNAFELCVLKLLASGRYEPKDIAGATCLPGDLIQIVLLRLYDRGKIDEHYQLLPDVQKAIEKLDGVSPYENAKYETYAIFRECIGGEVLPMIVGAKLRAEEMDEKGRIKGGKIFLGSLHADKKKVSAPDVPAVIVALRTMARRRRMSGETYRIPSEEFVAVSNDSEKCELRVRMVMQESGEWRILNPFGKGWAPELEAVYQQLLQKNGEELSAFKSWQQKFRRSPSDRKRDEQGKDQTREPYDTFENQKRYPELIGALKRKQDVYAVLEWALFYSLQLVDTKPIAQFLQIATKENIEKEIAAALTGMGGRLPDKGRLPVPSSSQFNAFGYDDIARMQTILPIAILAAGKSPNVRMRSVLQRYPNFVSRVMDLKNIRDLKRHGKIDWDEIYSDDDRDMMRQVVTSLIPQIRFAEVAQGEEPQGEDILDEQMDALVNLQDMFGVSEFNRLDGILKDRLLSAERFWLNSQPRDGAGAEIRVDALNCINDLYAACQCAFRPFLDRERPNDFSLEKIRKKAISVGLGKLPTSLLTVQDSMLQKTLAGDDQTLGACVIVWIFVSDAGYLHRVVVKQPSFLDDIDNLLRLSKHANQVCMMRADEIGQVREATYKLIKNITEE